MHPRYEVDRALSLVAEGLNDCEVSRRTGISRRTILDWRHGRAPHASWTRVAARGPCPRCESGPLDEPAYSSYSLSIGATAGSREILAPTDCASWQHWPCLFPQHGPGRKHHRSIVLDDWQNRIVGSDPRQLLRGLIHSDGCRTINPSERRAIRLSALLLQQPIDGHP